MVYYSRSRRFRRPRRSYVRRRSRVSLKRRRYVSRYRRRIKRRLPLASVPKSKLVRCRWAGTYSFDASAAAAAAHNFRANTLYDPDFTTAGANGTPSGVSLLSQSYSTYVVLGSKIRIEVVPTSGGTGIPCQIFLAKVQGYSSTRLSSIFAADGIPGLLVQPRCKRLAFASQGSGGYFRRSVLSMTYSAKKDQQYETVAYGNQGTDFGTDPDNYMLYSMLVCSPDGVVDPVDIAVYVTIEYIALLTEPIEYPLN